MLRNEYVERFYDESFRLRRRDSNKGKPIRKLRPGESVRLLSTFRLAARNMQRTLKTRRAAGYLRKRGVPFETALYWLTGRVAGVTL